MAETLTLEDEAATYQRELVGYCYRFFGSYAEAEDAVQETMLRAWQHRDEFAGRSSLRTWLYRIATNTCLDMRRAPQRRSLPMDLTSPGQVPDDPTTLVTRPEATWVGPISDAHLGDARDPADIATRRESVRLAFVTALQVLPPRQRVTLILRDVLAWSAQECADLLGITVAAVNSALARARKTLAAHDAGTVNGQPAVAVYHAVGDGRWEPFALHVLDTASVDGRRRITAITHFMGPAVFAQLELPDHITDQFSGPASSI